MIGRQRNHAGRHLLLLGLLFSLTSPFLAHAVPMVNDPNGFQNLTWGATLTTRPDLEIITAGPHVNEFQLRNGAPSYAGVPVESVRFVYLASGEELVWAPEQEDLPHIAQALAAHVDGIWTQPHYPALTGSHCARCPFACACPAQGTTGLAPTRDAIA